MASLGDAPGPGRPRELDPRAIVAETLRPQPRKLGMVRWSERLLADRLKNFTHMPELRWTFGYPLAIGLMIASATALWVFFKRSGWL